MTMRGDLETWLYFNTVTLSYSRYKTELRLLFSIHFLFFVLREIFKRFKILIKRHFKILLPW